MKKIILTAGLITATSTFYAQENKNETIEGNGKFETKNISVQSFDVLKARGVYELNLSQGNTESLKIEADENLHQYFNVRNVGSSLVIDMDKLDKKNVNFKSKNRIKVYVTFKKIKTLEIKTVGDVVSTGALTFDDLQINSKGVGNIDLKLTANKFGLISKGVGDILLSGKAESAEIMNAGVGSIQAGNFIVQAMNIENSGIGSTEVHAARELKMKANGLGKVKNKGAAPVPKKSKVVEI